MCVQCSHCETITCVCIHTHTHSHMHSTHLQINVLNSIYISNWNCENVYSMVMVTILLFLLLFANAFNFKLCLFCVYTFLVDLTDKHEFRFTHIERRSCTSTHTAKPRPTHTFPYKIYTRHEHTIKLVECISFTIHTHSFVAIECVWVWTLVCRCCCICCRRCCCWCFLKSSYGAIIQFRFSRKCNKHHKLCTRVTQNNILFSSNFDFCALWTLNEHTLSN